jgi:hypothetical protein
VDKDQRCLHLRRFTKEKEEVIALIHTDDVVMIGGSEEMMKEIMDECDKEWGVKQIDSDVILGVKCIAKEDKIIGERLHNWDTNSLTY